MNTSKTTFDIEQNKLVLDEIKMVRASITNDLGITSLDPDDEFDLDCTLEGSIRISVNKIKTTLNCNLKSQKHEQVSGQFSLSYFFSVENLEGLVEHFDEAKNELKLNEQLLDSLVNITYSTSRGIIYSRCLGTIFNKVILPVYPTKKILEKLM